VTTKFSEVFSGYQWLIAREDFIKDIPDARLNKEHERDPLPHWLRHPINRPVSHRHPKKVPCSPSSRTEVQIL